MSNENKVLQIADYMRENNMLDEYLAIVISEDSGRRIMDVVYNSYWCSFFNNGDFRETYDFGNQREEVKIGDYCKSAIQYYLSVTGCNPSRKQYKRVFPQLTKSKISKSLKKASEELAFDTFEYVPLSLLKKDGAEKTISQNKREDVSSEVYALSLEDMKKVIRYFEDKNMWLHYLLFTISYNMGRRISDTLSFTWDCFFEPCTGDFRENIPKKKEKKTKKFTDPHINKACRDAINLYIQKTNCDVTKDNYSTPVFMQLTGTHKGNVISQSGYLKALKKAASDVGIKYNVGTHSTRKTFGMVSVMTHPGDPLAMETLQKMFAHSNQGVTTNYIGIDRNKMNTYYEDAGNFFTDYIVGDKEYKDISENPIISLDANDLRDIIKCAYEYGLNNADSADAMAHIDSINHIMQMVEKMAK